MTDGTDEPGDRWQQLIGSFDPERNLRAAAEPVLPGRLVLGTAPAIDH